MKTTTTTTTEDKNKKKLQLHLLELVPGKLYQLCDGTSTKPVDDLGWTFYSGITERSTWSMANLESQSIYPRKLTRATGPLLFLNQFEILREGYADPSPKFFDVYQFLCGAQQILSLVTGRTIDNFVERI